MIVRPYCSGDNSEKACWLDIHGMTKDVVYWVYLPDLANGETLVVGGECQVTSDHDYNIMVQGQAVLMTKPGNSGGREITEMNGGNVTPDMHHMKMTVSGIIEVPSWSYRYVAWRMWSKASRAQVGDKLTIDRDYGRLWVARFS